MIRLKILLAGFPILVCAVAAQAATITYITPSATTDASGQALDASAKVITGAGFINVTLTNLQGNLSDVAQLLSDLDLTLSNGTTTGTLFSSAGQQITVNAGGTTSIGSSGSTGWVLKNNVSGGLQLAVGSKGLIIGPSGPGGKYTTADASIAGNSANNAFINGSDTFIIDIAGVTATTTVTGATFVFGMTAVTNIAGCVSTNLACSGQINLSQNDAPSVPEPMSLLLSGSGLLGLFFLRRRSTSR